MTEHEQTRVRTWPRDLAIFAVAIVVGVGGFALYNQLTDDSGSSGTTIDGPAGFEPVTSGSGGSDLTIEPGAGTDVVPVDPADASDAQTAVSSFLAAEINRDFATSFSFLTADIQSRLGGSSERWRAEHAQLLPYTGFEILEETERDGDPAVRTVVSLDSRLDTVIGLVPARAEAIWVVEESGGTFRVDFDNSFIQPLFPDDAPARGVALAWAEAVQAGEDPGELQGVTSLYGRRSLKKDLADSTGALDAGEPVALPPDAGSSDLLSAFGSDVAGWGRVVAIDGPVDVNVVLAPVNDEWVVIGILDPR